jgi:transcriptional regulator with XRE-family HTH domain
MSLKQWEQKVLEAPGAPERVREIEDELRLATGLTALREQAGLTQRELAERIGVSQPRIAAIERSHNVTVDVLEQYVHALGGQLELTVIHNRHRTSLLGPRAGTKPARPRKSSRKGTPPNAATSPQGRRKSA